MSNAAPAARIALITGAAQGIGRAIALRLAEDGLDIAMNDIPSKQDLLEQLAAEIQAKGRNALVVTGDCSKEQDVQNMVNSVVDQLKGLDVMVANAGIARPGGLLEYSVEDWEEVSATNIRGVFLCYKFAAAQMIKQGRGGRIIGASSICGKKGYANLSAYCSSKFAVRGLTQCAALEWGKHGITVNAYAPGIIETPMSGGVGSGGSRAREIMQIPHAPTGQPEDVANMVSYLVKPEAQFITGQSIIVDGGVQFD